VRPVVAAGCGLACWGLFEAQWLDCKVVDVAVVDLPPALDGLSILHLSDLHAGTVSLNLRALRRAVDFGVEMRPDLVAITGDLISHPRAIDAVERELARLRPPLGAYAVTGNHDVGATSDPFSKGVVIEDWGAAGIETLRDRSAVLRTRGRAIELAGVDAATWLHGRSQPHRLFGEPGAFRILLAHFPDTAERLPAGVCSLVLCGHLHGGQICLPGPRGRIKLSHGDWRFDEGVFEHGGTTVVVSRGVGTTLVPFRFLSRPEVCLLRLTRES
jgi:predicted MPP superfamily phosphohydrolase